MPGPPPSPAELRLLKGDGKSKDSAGRPVKRQPRTVSAEPDMPEGLGKFGERKWREVVPELVRMGILGRIDAAALEAYCRLYEEWRNHKGGHGYATLTMTMVKVGSTLGLDPAARMRMTLPEAEDGEESDIFGASAR